MFENYREKLDELRGVACAQREASGSMLRELAKATCARSTATIGPSMTPGRPPSTHQSDNHEEMLEIITRISKWAGGDAQALAWYRGEPIPAFGGRTAESLVKDGKAGAVRDYLDAVANGSFA